MTYIRPVVLAIACAFLGVAAWPADPADHKVHHPETAASSAKDDMAKMDIQMKSMQEMHEKMMSAQTSEERKALMADHMVAMQAGMSMMREAGKDSMKGDMPADTGTRQQMMEKHMDMMDTTMQMMEKRMGMMETTMQMMMDRLPPPPSS
jgi:hypothetical protein